jgi:hypothetical protein
MMGSDACDDRDGLLYYRALRARAPEGSTAETVTVVTVVTVVTEAVFLLHGRFKPRWVHHLKMQAESRPA